MGPEMGFRMGYATPMKPFLVRPTTEDDLGEVTRIYSHYVLHSAATFEVDPPSRDEMAKRRSHILAIGLPYLVAEHEGAIAGYAYASEYRPRPAYRFTVEDSIYIDPQYVGQGCGLALLGTVIELCEQGPWRQMIAVIGDSGNYASIRLHRRFGFRDAGTLFSVGFKFNQWVDTALMQRELVPRNAVLGA
jgi:L-amino acid N-acyltransferase YncA